MLGVRSHTSRPELEAEHGFDAKFAMHMIRLGIQGIEYMESGKTTLPLADPIARGSSSYARPDIP